MKRKSGKIGLVVADGQLRAAQVVDGQIVASAVPCDENLKKCVRQLLSSAPFVGKKVAVGLQGSAVLVESVVLPPGTKSARALCSDRLKGDPIFNAEKAVMGYAEESISAGPKNANKPPLVVMAALLRARLDEIVGVCRELQLDIESVECGAVAAWRAWPGEGMQVRVVRAGDSDIVLAGRDERLLFVRVVPSPVSGGELKATVARAVGAIGGGTLDAIETVGVDEPARKAWADELGVRVDVAPSAAEDPIALGLASEGRALVDFTPPEERVLREKRKVRKYGISLTAACALLVLVAGVAGAREADDLERQKADLQDQLAILQLAKNELAALKAELEKETSNDQVINLAYPGHRMSTLFALIAQTAGEAVMAETIKIEDREKLLGKGEGAPDADEPMPRVLDVRITGIAADNLAVRRFADGLLETQAFSDVQVEASERVLIGVGVEGERFRIFARAETR